MARGGPLDLAREPVQGDRTLRARLEVPELDVARRELVADDHREVGAVARGSLELPAELAHAEIGPCGDALGPEERRDPQALDRGARIRADDDGLRRRFGRTRADPGLLEREEDPVESDPEPDPRRRTTAERLDEVVVAAAAPDRRLLA